LSVERRVATFLHLAVDDLDAAEMLARIGNRNAAYHVQQAIEKIIKALLLHRGIEAGIEHRLENLVDRLPEGDPWSNRLEEWLEYSAYATTYRYPMPGGGIPRGPAASQVLGDVEKLREVERRVREETAPG
jgi:HEPN domain-containing protein